MPALAVNLRVEVVCGENRSRCMEYRGLVLVNCMPEKHFSTFVIANKKQSDQLQQLF